MTPPFHHRDFDSRNVGVDETKGRFGKVSIEICKTCGSYWLHYLVEYEGFSNSGRWYRGLVPEDIVKTITPETTVAVLEKLEWRFVGGSFFDSTGTKSTGPVLVDM